MADRYKVVFDYDQDADMSWLEQDMYDPKSPEYSGPSYRSKEDMDAGREPIDPEWLRDPDNHVALEMLVYRMSDSSDDWDVVDSLGGIDFFVDGDDWATGTWYRPEDIPSRCLYQRQLFEEAIEQAKAA
jgi:hypothetical protein